MKIISSVLRNNFLEDINRKDMRDRRISDLDDVISAVKEIYRGKVIYPRSGPNASRKVLNHGPHAEDIDILLRSIGTKIHDYFTLDPNCDNTQANFDVFHEELCKQFLDGINELRRTAGLANLTYGQAQKLINLTFKYLTTYADYETYAYLFRFCHMTIDRIVLKALSNKNSLSEFLGTNVSTRLNVANLSWTKMSKEEYYELVNEYRNILDGMLGDKTYMHLEYCIWNKGKHDLISLPDSGEEEEAIEIRQFHK